MGLAGTIAPGGFSATHTPNALESYLDYFEMNSALWFIKTTAQNSPGTPGTIRTYDTWFRRPVLYPLSYGCKLALRL